MHVEEALNVLENHLLNLGGLGCPNGVLLQVKFELDVNGVCACCRIASLTVRCSAVLRAKLDQWSVQNSSYKSLTLGCISCSVLAHPCFSFSHALRTRYIFRIHYGQGDNMLLMILGSKFSVSQVLKSCN